MKQINQTARSVCLRALLQMERDEGYSNIVLDKALAASMLSSRDKSLASTIFYGVLERRLTLDYFLRHCLREPQKKPDRAALAALRCGAYQLLYLERVPDAAAVNETVAALKLIGKPQLAGFVNGVLRGLLRKKETLLLPEDNTPAFLSLRYSVPEGLIRLWQKGYGEAVSLKLLESFSERPQAYIRVNTTRCTAAELQAHMERQGVNLICLSRPEGAAILENCGSPCELPEFHQGFFHVQDLSAQLVCRLLEPQPGETVCDCCAAPGGKSFTLAQGVGADGKVYAFDLHKGRVKLIEGGAKRLGLSMIETGVNDASQGFDVMPLVDKMLCDVPCSGFGVIRRKPEIRYRNLDEVKKLPALQYAILAQAAKRVKPGGILVYSTCTLNPAENNRVAERFLKENDGFRPMKIDLGLEHCVDEPEHMLTMTPFSGGSDGFFAAAFQKER